MKEEAMIEAARRFRKSNAHAYQFINKSGVTAEAKMMTDFTLEQIKARDEAWSAAINRVNQRGTWHGVADVIQKEMSDE